MEKPLPFLTTLQLANNQITEIHCQNLTSLKVLIVDGNNITKIDKSRELNGLEVLSIARQKGSM